MNSRIVRVSTQRFVEGRGRILGTSYLLGMEYRPQLQQLFERDRRRSHVYSAKPFAYRRWVVEMHAHLCPPDSRREVVLDRHTLFKRGASPYEIAASQRNIGA